MRVTWRSRQLLGLVAVVRVAAAEPSPETKPWRIGTAIESPSWLELGLEQQSRVEHLSHDFRGKATGDATGLSMRTLASARATFRVFLAGLELEDSRFY